MLQNAQIKTPNYKTPDATKRPMQKIAQCYKMSTFYVKKKTVMLDFFFSRKFAIFVVLQSQFSGVSRCGWKFKYISFNFNFKENIWRRYSAFSYIFKSYENIYVHFDLWILNIYVVLSTAIAEHWRKRLHWQTLKKIITTMKLC